MIRLSVASSPSPVSGEWIHDDQFSAALFDGTDGIVIDGTYIIAPTGTPWVYTGQAGVARGGVYGFNWELVFGVPALFPNGFIHDSGSISQLVTVPVPGTYRLTLSILSTTDITSLLGVIVNDGPVQMVSSTTSFFGTDFVLCLLDLHAGVNTITLVCLETGLITISFVSLVTNAMLLQGNVDNGGFEHDTAWTFSPGSGIYHQNTIAPADQLLDGPFEGTSYAILIAYTINDATPGWFQPFGRHGGIVDLTQPGYARQTFGVASEDAGLYTLQGKVQGGWRNDAYGIRGFDWVGDGEIQVVLDGHEIDRWGSALSWTVGGYRETPLPGFHLSEGTHTLEFRRIAGPVEAASYPSYNDAGSESMFFLELDGVRLIPQEYRTLYPFVRLTCDVTHPTASVRLTHAE